MIVCPWAIGNTSEKYSGKNAAFNRNWRIALALDTSMDYLAGLTDDPRPYPRKPQEGMVK